VVHDAVEIAEDLRHQLDAGHAASALQSAGGWFARRLAPRSGFEIGFGFVPRDSLAGVQHLRPALIGNPVELFLKLCLLHGLRNGIENERVGSRARPLGSGSDARLEIVFEPYGGRAHLFTLEPQWE